MNKIGRKLQTRTMNLLRGLLTLAATFVLLTVVLPGGENCACGGHKA